MCSQNVYVYKYLTTITLHIDKERDTSHIFMTSGVVQIFMKFSNPLGFCQKSCFVVIFKKFSSMTNAFEGSGKKLLRGIGYTFHVVLPRL